MFAALEPLTDADLGRDAFIRGERHSVMQAINRQIAHYSYHVGQIVFLAKHLQSAKWKSLSVPRGGSASFNKDVAEGARASAETERASGIFRTPLCYQRRSYLPATCLVPSVGDVPERIRSIVGDE